MLDRNLSGGGRGSAGGSRASVHLIVPLRDLLADRGHTQSNRPTTGSRASGAGGHSQPRDTEGGPDRGNGRRVSGNRADADASSRTGDTEGDPDRGAGRRVSGNRTGAGDDSRAGNTDAGPDRGTGRRVSGNLAGIGDSSRTGDAGGGPHVSESSAGAGDSSRTGDADTGPDDADGGHDVGSGVGDGSRTGDPRGDRVGRSAAAGDHCGQRSAPEPGDADWPFHFDWTGPMSRAFAELLTCDADLTPVIVDHHGVPLALGRSTRLASDDQRIALTIRDRCCVMCGRPAQWCQAHHVKFWEHGGRTDLNNLALVCGECHRLVHHGDWQLLMGDDGHPYAVPPESIDPTRQPIPSYHRRKRRAA
ncbi:hypothetical protein CH259_04520 [Rhodococcus sp. 05-2254-4]|nr:hypothetical protein CH259_04520 [Rhodococcus sp. 05-2254-4]OZE50011.1 hypothetical protein CH261_02955 [Rhodococcus sp. 05-2254-3]OZE50874.1 hypothetical protein CH283_10260 [Rhodococcus sp. 05-2254-2]